SCQLSCDHPSLHSFPTRRSSDLDVLEVDDHAVGGEGRGAPPLAPRVLRHRRALVLRDVAEAEGELAFRAEALRTHLVGADARRRSEEHTSELQSRFDLVCRLLLE